MKPRTFWIATLALVLANAGAQELDEATRARIAKSESGPGTIDVSGYPQAAQENYKVFCEKCSQCHKLNRPINSDYVVPEEWSRYIKRMMYKPGSNIDKNAAKKIFDFLVYDGAIRKKALLEEKLAKLPAAERKTAEDKIAEVQARYGKN